MLHSSNSKSSIAHRFIFYIVIFSSCITLVMTSIQLYRDYNTDLDLIYTELDQIEGVHLNNLIAALWASDAQLLQTNIEGILKIRDVQYIEVRDEDKIWARAGIIQSEDNIQRSYPLKYFHRNRDINIGTLTVNVSLKGVYQRLIDKVWVILISNAIKTAMVAIFIYFLFYQLVARHISTISAFTKDHDPLSNNKLLALDRQGKRNDELDTMVTSINQMHARLSEQLVIINQQKQYLSQALNSIGDAVITTDDKGNVLSLNPVAEQLTGWTSDEARKQPLKTIFPIVNATTRETIENPVEKVLTTGETIYLSNHTTLISKDGTEYQIADSAAPIISEDKILGMVLVFNDITEQYKVRQELNKNISLLKKITARVPGMVYQFELEADGSMSFPYMSDAVNDLYHVSAEEVREDVNRIFSLTHPDDVKKLNDSILESARTFSPWKLEYRIRDKDGTVRWLFGDSVPEKMTGGKILWHGFVTEITDKKEAEENLRLAQKMDALGNLTGGIAHDYNNMLGVVLGYSELLEDTLEEHSKQHKYIERIRHAGERGAKLTKKLLAFSKSKASDAEKVDVNKLLEEEQHMLEKTLTARITLNLKLKDNLWPVNIDGSELEDAILNIAINASHAIEGNGELSIETRNNTVNQVNAEKLGIIAGDYVLIEITDTGCGIDDDIKRKIFDPFYSTKKDKGTGLGLSQVYGFVNRCDGIVTVDSILGQGTQFTLYFPRYEGSDNKKHEFEAGKEIDLKGKESILVVDDELALLELTCEVLNQKGYQVYSAERAKEALNILETRHIDLMVSDIIMPDMDGFTLASIVQEKYPNIKIQLASGFSSGDHKSQKDNELTKNILQKPYNAKKLLERIRILLF